MKEYIDLLSEFDPLFLTWLSEVLNILSKESFVLNIIYSENINNIGLMILDIFFINNGPWEEKKKERKLDSSQTIIILWIIKSQIFQELKKKNKIFSKIWFPKRR